MAEHLTGALPLGQTAPVERLRDSRREAVDREGQRRNPRKPGPPAPVPGRTPEPETPGDTATGNNSGKIVDIVI